MPAWLGAPFCTPATLFGLIAAAATAPGSAAMFDLGGNDRPAPMSGPPVHRIFNGASAL